ncbi:MAG: hypothetical protein VW362_11005 [Candidatus Nanopelagicales bacterium]
MNNGNSTALVLVATHRATNGAHSFTFDAAAGHLSIYALRSIGYTVEVVR